MDIVFRVGGDGYEGVLFARREDAERVAQIREALRRSKTWGEFRANLPPGEWESNLQERFLIGEEPPDDEAFTAGDMPGDADAIAADLRSMGYRVEPTELDISLTPGAGQPLSERARRVNWPNVDQSRHGTGVFFADGMCGACRSAVRTRGTRNPAAALRVLQRVRRLLQADVQRGADADAGQDVPGGIHRAL